MNKFHFMAIVIFLSGCGTGTTPTSTGFGNRYYETTATTRSQGANSGRSNFSSSGSEQNVNAYLDAILAASTPPTPSIYPPAPPQYALSPAQHSSSSSRIYTGNCPTPDSYDAAGRRCGARSAASRAGGYDGYGSWAPTYRRSYNTYGKSSFVRGHYRKNGSYVRPHYRSSRRR